MKFPLFKRVCFSSHLPCSNTCFSVVAFACWTGKCVGVASKNRGNGILHALKDFTYSNDDGDKRGAQRKFAKRGREKGAKSLQNAVSVKCELVAATRRHTQRDNTHTHTHTWQLQPENSQVERKWLKSFLCKQHLTNNKREKEIKEVWERGGEWNRECVWAELNNALIQLQLRSFWTHCPQISWCYRNTKGKRLRTGIRFMNFESLNR